MSIASIARNLACQTDVLTQENVHYGTLHTRLSHLNLIGGLEFEIE